MNMFLIKICIPIEGEDHKKILLNQPKKEAHFGDRMKGKDDVRGRGMAEEDMESQQKGHLEIDIRIFLFLLPLYNFKIILGNFFEVFCNIIWQIV